MRTYLKGLCGAAVLAVAAASLMTVQTSAPAEAQARKGCVNCAKGRVTRTRTIYRYRTVRRVRNVTRYKDVNRTRYRRHVTRVINVTRVQPITRVNVVRRVHNRTVILRQRRNVARVQRMPTRTITRARTIQINHPPTYGSCCR